MHKNKSKTLNFRSYAIVLIIIALVLGITGYLILNSIHNFYNNQMAEESQRLAKSHANNLETAIQAVDIINDLLEEKLMAAGKISILLDQKHSNELLLRFSRTMKVDRIYSYNDKGEILYSNTGEYIGWTAYEGHPVYDFMQSGEENFVEDIRQDTESGVFYKYGYFRAQNGYFIQIGFLAEKIHEFLGGFEMQQLLDKMKSNKFVDTACFIDNDFNLIACNNGKISIDFLTPQTKSAILKDMEYMKMVMVDGKNLYQIMLPVYVNGEKIGTLIMGHDVQNTENLLNNIIITGIITLVLIYILLFVSVIVNYSRNKRLANYAYYDLLSGLPNRRQFEEFYNNDINSGREGKRAVILVNYRNFRLINLTFGYNYGEKLIKKLAESLSSLKSENHRLFHLSADRFIIYIKNYKNKDELSALCEKIIVILKAVLASNTIGGNIGVLEIRDYKVDSDDLLKNVSIAAGNASENELYGVCFFNSDMEEKLQRVEDIKNELANAAADNKNDDFYLEYQPILNLKTNKICGFEALARLKTKKLGFVSPLEFIPIAENTQLIVPLGKHVLYMACQFLKMLEDQGNVGLQVSVNISAIQLQMDDFYPDLMRIINETGINPSELCLEITESVFSNNYEAINNILAKIKEQGMKIAIDDFGTGYSSLARVKELNVNYLKIDKSFMDKLLSMKSEESITGDIISMAHRLGHEVIAEGVEYSEQTEYLKKNDCDCIQGFVFKKPLPQEAAIKLLNKNYNIQPIIKTGSL